MLIVIGFCQCVPFDQHVCEVIGVWCTMLRGASVGRLKLATDELVGRPSATGAPGPVMPVHGRFGGLGSVCEVGRVVLDQVFVFGGISETLMREVAALCSIAALLMSRSDSIVPADARCDGDVASGPVLNSDELP